MSKQRSISVILITMLMVLTTIITGIPAVAQGESPTTGKTELPEITSPSILEKLFPMTTEAEASIVHKVPPARVIVNGSVYKPENICLFDGHRLHFSMDRDGQLYAFTTAKGLEEFVRDQMTEPCKSIGIDSWGATVFDGIFYGSPSLDFDVWEGKYTLGDLNEKVSSVIKDSTPVALTLYDGIYWSGDSYTFLYNQEYPMLWLYGWNDKASSGSC
jgi:hypothetical protein